jgi:hypothetical protein
MPVNLLPAYGTGIQIHVEHLADYITGWAAPESGARAVASDPGVFRDLR